MTDYSAEVLVIELPFPPRGLNPNARLHWRVKAQLAAEYRAMCGWAAKAEWRTRLPLPPPVTARVLFVLPNRRRRDLDNLLASMKSGWDGLIDAGVLTDDRIGMLKVEVDEVQYSRRPSVKVTLQTIR